MDENKLFTLGKELGEVASTINTAMADKKISLVDGIAIGKEIAQLGIFAVKHRELLVESFGNGISVDERNDLNAGFKEGYEDPTGETENLVELMFEAALSIATGISIFVDVKRAKELKEEAEKEAAAASDDVTEAPAIPEEGDTADAADSVGEPTEPPSE